MFAEELEAFSDAEEFFFIFAAQELIFAAMADGIVGAGDGGDDVVIHKAGAEVMLRWGDYSSLGACKGREARKDDQ